MDAKCNAEGLSGNGAPSDVPEEMLAELQREIARNQEAVRLVKERELQALSAKLRAEESHKKMNDMIAKYEDMRRKLELTRMTLAETKSQIELHNQTRSDTIREAVMKLKERADVCTEKLRATRGDPAGAGDLDFQISAGHDDDFGGLTDSERALLALCQGQQLQVPTTVDTTHLAGAPCPEPVAVDNTITSETTTTATTTAPREDRATRRTNSIYEDTVLSLQERFSRKTKTAAAPHLPRKSPTADEGIPPLEGAGPEDPSGAGSRQGSPAEELDVREVTMDLSEAVVKIEAKCAGVREKLSQMAVAEQYMRTKQAQLLAKRREREAVLALEKAARKEQEVEEMRKKISDMTLLLEERRKKLMATETVMEKKAQVVDKVNKILNSKERRAAHVQKQRDECLAFDRVLKKTP